MTISPLRNARDLNALLDILSPTFNFARELGERYTRIVGRKNYRVARQGSAIVGGCALLPFGQYFGGRRVSMMGVGAVGVAPEHRGRKVASTLMQSILREMHRRGFALSALYPATLPLYRSVGYEQAGTRFEIRIPAKTLNFKGLDRGDNLDVRRITLKDEPAIRKCYAEKAQRNPGNLDRSDFIWHRIHAPRGQKTMGFMVINPRTRQVEGYTIYYQKDVPEAPYSLMLTDVVSLTPAAGRRILSFFADHRSMTHEIVFQGSPDDAILKVLPERNFVARLLDHWMLRIVDVPKALTQRGYSPCVRGEVHLEIRDELIKSNDGRFAVTVDGGKARVRRGGEGRVRISIAALAPLYSGHQSPEQLQACGDIETGKSAREDLDTLAAMFAGPMPWLPDMF